MDKDIKKLPIIMATRAKKIIIETGKDLYNNVVDYVASDIQSNIETKRLESLPTKGVIGITGDVHSVKTFEDLESKVGSGNAIDFFPVTKSIETWKRMNEKTEIGPMIRERAERFKDCKEIYLQVGSYTKSEELERAKKIAENRYVSADKNDFVTKEMFPTKALEIKADKVDDDFMFDNIKRTIKKRLTEALSKLSSF